MNTPNPALVSQRAVQRLPRLVLLMFCAAYVLPGLFGRDPWRSSDVTAFGFMASVAQGHSPWWSPSVAGLSADAALLPYWLGAAVIRALSGWLDPAFAARLPFALLLVATLVMTWYSCYHLARTEAAQPLPFAFGGEADPVDYARAVADGALLALIATLGLLQLGHETTPELAQLASVSVLMYGLAASPFRGRRARLAVLLALPALAASGGPSIAVLLGLASALVCWRSAYLPVRGFTAWVLAGLVLAVLTASLLQAWHWRLVAWGQGDVLGFLRQLAWFTWPTLPLAAWTLWRWRRHWGKRHIAVPLACGLSLLVACVAMGGAERVLMLALPALAVLTAFALPTLQRSSAAAIDWFSVFFFSIAAVVIWVVYIAMQTGVPARPAANVLRLAPGFVPSFSTLALVVAVAGSLAWLALVRWRTGRHQQALWKSMVLPASGVALCWLLLMSLWLPLLNYARSDKPLVDRIARHVPRDAGCLAAPNAPRAQLAALEQLGRFTVEGHTAPESTRCAYLVRQENRRQLPEAPAGWTLVAREQRPTERVELTAIYRRNTP